MKKSAPQFGKQRLNDFYVDKTFTNLNHASYGYTPKTVIQHKRSLEQRMEFNTQKWFRYDLQEMINEFRGYVAKQVNASKDNIFFVQNATDAFNGLMKSIHWKQGDVILLPNTAYAAIRKTTEWLRDYYKIQILDLNFTHEDLNSWQSIQLKIEDQVNKFPRKIRCAIFDHISSFPSVVFPINAIKLFLEQKNIDLFVDGAHAANQVDINLTALDCDAYFSNFHKWSFTPKNAAFIYISNKYLKDVRPALTGNFRGEGIARQYFWTGTRDCTAYLCVQNGVQYLESFGAYQVRNYNKNIVLQGAKLMAQLFKTKLLSADERCSGYMVSLYLPCDDQEMCDEILQQMLKKHNIYFIAGEWQDKIFARISGQIYNELQDYRKAAEVFLQILKQKQAKKHIKAIK